MALRTLSAVRLFRSAFNPRCINSKSFSKQTNFIFQQNVKNLKWYCTKTSETNPASSEPIKPLSSLSSLFPKPPEPQQDHQKEEEEAKKTREASWRTMKYTLMAFGISFSVLGTWLVIELGAPRKDEDGNLIHDEFSSLPIVQQYFYRLINELEYYKKMIKEPSREKLLPDPVSYPYYQPPYTLVLELTDVLVHPDWTYQTGWRFKKRPGIDHFLQQVGPPLYEIVVFTAETGMTVFPIIEALDPNQVISYKLVRDATHFEDGHHIKNLDKLNRDLSKVVVVDWNGDSVKFHPENCLKISRWKGNDDDSTLIDLAAFLKTVATSNVEDVRDVLQYYKNFEDPLAAFRDNQRRLLEQQEAQKEAEALQPKPLTKSWSHSFLRK